MSEKHTRRQYRIGDFAKFMGVTPDFLKHYEDFGLLSVQHRSGGYRWYGFEQAALIMEYLRLRNYGVIVRDMAPMLAAGEEEAFAALDRKASELERRIARETAVLEEHRRIMEWHRERHGKSSDWEVKEVEPLCFLPHSNQCEFLRDERVYGLLREWVEWFPVVKTGIGIFAPERGEKEPVIQLGLIVAERQAKRLGIPLNEAVRHMPGGKAFVYHFSENDPNAIFENFSEGRHPLFAKMRELGLKGTGSVYAQCEMRLSDPKDCSLRFACGRFIVPLSTN
ncbi:MAG: hypothetical protein ACFWTZ_04075 [Burkholderia sp.]|jgi:DNA-binding transcriptional MerR regulator